MLSLKQKNNPPFLLLVILIAIPILLPLFHPGVFVTDDLDWMIIRFSAFHQSLADGQIPVRWLGRLNHEYGYPVANFLYPGFLYLAEIPKLLGFGFIASIKFILGASVVFGSIFTYLWLSKLFDRWASFLGTFFYLYTPYYLFDLYKRGSLGEILALATAPFILWQIERRNVFWSSIGVAMLILSHNTLALFFLPIIVIYMFLRKQLTITSSLLTLGLGLGLSAFFWMPALFDLQYTKFSQTQVSNWQEHFADINLIGLGAFVVLLGSLVVLRNRRKELVPWFFLLVTTLAIFLSLPIGAVIGQVLPASFIQFPFRLLSIVILGGAFLTAFLLGAIEEKRKIQISIILVSVMLFSVSTFMSLEYRDKEDAFYTTNEHSTTVHNEYMPKWVQVPITERSLQKVEISGASLLQKQNVGQVGKVDDLVVRSNHVTFTAVMTQEGNARINIIYFPGWEASIDGNKTPIDYENEWGVMNIAVPKGEHIVVLRFGETPIRLASDIISIGSLLLLVGLALRRKAI